MRRGRDLPCLVQNRRDRIRAKRLRVAREFLGPKAERLGIGDMADDTFAKAIVGVEARQVDQCRVPARDERRDAMVEKMLKPRPPAV